MPHATMTFRSSGSARRWSGAGLVPRRLVLGLAMLALAGCGPGDVDDDTADFDEEALAGLVGAAGERHTGDLDQIRERGVLRALVTYSRTEFFLDHGRIRGIQAELLRDLERQLNKGVERPEERLRVRFLPVTFDQLIPALEAGLGDVAAAFLTVTPERRERVSFAVSRRLAVDEIVVTHPSARPVKALEDLAGRSVYVLRGSSYAEHLRALAASFRGRGLAPVRVVEADPHLLSEDILEMVNAGIVGVTVVDRYRAELWAKVLPDIVLREDVRVSAGKPVGWAFRRDSPLLRAELERFVARRDKGSLVGNVLFKRYFESARWISDPTGGARQDRLEKHLSLFRKYAERYGHDPLALAAVAFQESRLRHDRRSSRGAVGIMQLLPSTARDENVGIPDIGSVENNIRAGAKYLAFLRDRYFADPAIAPDDRRALTWAAYNAGPARVREMRNLARELGLDPQVWFGNVEVAAGRLVGRETVNYVANVQKYYVAYRLGRRLRDQREAARPATARAEAATASPPSPAARVPDA